MKPVEIVKKTIKKQALLKKGDRVIVALSGGPDSVCLLHLLWCIGKEQDWTIGAVHVNHQLRGRAAEEDEQYVKALCAALNVELGVYTYDVASIAKKRGISTETAGRALRYQAFFEEKAKRKAHVIAVAHNRNDQAETVLMRMMRGTGVAGLGGMDYKREDGVIRPILDISREQIEEYCREKDLHPRIDQTNLQAMYTRNRIRLELLPYMEERFNENVIGALCRLATIAREETSFMDDLLDREMKQGCNRGENGGMVCSLEQVQKMHPALSRRFLQKILGELGLTQNVSFSHLEQAEQVIASQEIAGGKTKVAEFPGGFRMECRNQELFFFLLPDQELEKSRFRALKGKVTEKLIPKDSDLDLKTLPKNRGCFDYEKVVQTGLAMTLRTRQTGDFIQPLGMKGTKKLQDYFVDRKVKQEERDQVPLICLGQEVIWVIGGQISEGFKVTSHTDTILLLEFNGEI